MGDTLQSNPTLNAADIVDIRFFGPDKYYDGQPRCCKGKLPDGCACMSTEEGSCRPKCNDYLGNGFQGNPAETQGTDPGRLRRAEEDEVMATVAFSPSVSVADLKYTNEDSLKLDDGVQLTLVRDQI